MSPYDSWKLAAPEDVDAERERREARDREAADRDDELVHRWPKLARLVEYRQTHGR